MKTHLLPTSLNGLTLAGSRAMGCATEESDWDYIAWDDKATLGDLATMLEEYGFTPCLDVAYASAGRSVFERTGSVLARGGKENLIVFYSLEEYCYTKAACNICKWMVMADGPPSKNLRAFLHEAARGNFL